MRRPDIEVTIDELVVVGLSRCDAELVAEALRRELALVASAWDALPAAGLAAGPAAGLALDARPKPAGVVRVTPGMTPEALASQVAHAVHRQLVPPHVVLPHVVLPHVVPPGPFTDGELHRAAGGHEH